MDQEQEGWPFFWKAKQLIYENFLPIECEESGEESGEERGDNSDATTWSSSESEKEEAIAADFDELDRWISTSSIIAKSEYITDYQ